MSAHTVDQNTVIGFVNGSNLYYVTSNYDVKHLNTDQLVATNVTNEGEVQKCTFGNPVYGRDIAAGISMTVRTRNQKTNTNIGIAITQCRVDSDGWSVCEPLPTHQAMLLMSKWFVEHGMMELYQKQCNMAPNNAFLEWVTGTNIKFFPKSGKLQWYYNAMSIDYEMELRKCSFEECLCNKQIPSCNKRHIIPHEYYDDFGLYNETQRNRLWMEGKPNTYDEANLILHIARTKEYSDDVSALLSKIKVDTEQHRNFAKLLAQ